MSDNQSFQNRTSPEYERSRVRSAAIVDFPQPDLLPGHSKIVLKETQDGLRRRKKETVQRQITGPNGLGALLEQAYQAGQRSCPMLPCQNHSNVKIAAQKTA